MRISKDDARNTMCLWIVGMMVTDKDWLKHDYSKLSEQLVSLYSFGNDAQFFGFVKRYINILN